MATKAEETSGVPGRVTVRLQLPHTHAGKRHEPGAEISVRPAQAAWLAARGVIEPGPDAKKEG